VLVRKFSIYIFAILFLNGLFSCSEKKVDTSMIVTPIDSVTVLCDPSWESILRTFIVSYEGLNPHRKVLLLVKPEAECVHDLLNDRYRTVFVSRDFSVSELEIISKKQWHISNDSLCYDGLAWIVPKSFPKDSISVSELKELFQTGSFNGTTYSMQLNSSGSSVANYLTTMFGMPPSSKHIFTGGNDEAIIQSVQQHSNVVGCLSSSWLVNLKDKKHHEYFDAVKVLKVSKTSISEAYSPFQNDLALGTYPFKRVMRVLNHDANTGLGTAFASFFIHNRGQRIFLKAGLLPFKMPAREVELKINS
jgi:phosphate transport system substrate-binding protein